MRKVRSTAGRRRYRWDYQELRFLVYVLTQAKNFEETLNLFFDLHTPKEISEIIRRVIIVSLLAEGKTYEQIIKIAGTSPITIAKIQQKLLRPKSVLGNLLAQTGGFSQFVEQQTHQSDPIQRKIDRFLRRATLGVYQPENKRFIP